MNPQKKRRQDSEKQQLILQRNSQLHGVLLAALLAVVLLVFGLVNLLHTKRDFSENENRKLQAYPALTAASVLDGSFMSKLQSAFADQFFARDHWISAKLRIDQLLSLEWKYLLPINLVNLALMVIIIWQGWYFGTY